ncbi:carbohydrate binding domain-containing protein [Lactiplantibacillus plantarum]|uniref:carbohydrate binding domain-containing protein n=1 Tax=Lactiplantibacillus plantarum TaxID=1590 RepID=UPI00295C13AA|nr:carbohydrate binding domain-containing protein [Lactiplantibacillus plantarum]MDV9115392.1 phage tail protein [Lactiplantibacillus plantarum]
MAESNATQVILTDDGIKIINAQNTADNAASGVANLNDPNLMSVIEKQTQAAQYAGLTSQYNVVLAQAKEASISTTDLTTAYTNLNTFMSAILMDTTKASDVNRDNYKSLTGTYNTALSKVQKNLDDYVNNEFSAASSQAVVADSNATVAKSAADSTGALAETAFENNQTTSQAVTALKDGSTMTIAELANGLATKVADNDYETYKTQTKDLIASKVSKSDANNANLIPYSSHFTTPLTGWTLMNWGATDRKLLVTTHTFYQNGTGALLYLNTAQNGTAAAGSNRFPLLPNTTYTFQFKAFASSNVVGANVYLLSRAYGSTSDYDTVHGLFKNLVTSPSQIDQYTVTFTTGANDNEGYIRVDNIGSNNSASSGLFFTELKLELGDTATPYVYGGQDSMIAQTSDDVLIKVSKDELIDEINLQAGSTLISSSGQLTLSADTVYFDTKKPVIIPSANLDTVLVNKTLTAADITANTFSTNNGTFTVDKNGAITAKNMTLIGGILTSPTINTSTINGSTINGTTFHGGDIISHANNTAKYYPMTITPDGAYKSTYFDSAVGLQSSVESGAISYKYRSMIGNGTYLYDNVAIDGQGITLDSGTTTTKDTTFSAAETEAAYISLTTEAGLYLHGSNANIDFGGHLSDDSTSVGMYMNPYGNLIAKSASRYWQISVAGTDNTGGGPVARFGIDSASAYNIIFNRELDIGNFQINTGHTFTSADKGAIHFAKGGGGAADIYAGAVNYTSLVKSSLLSVKKDVKKADTAYWAQLVNSIDLATYQYKTDDNTSHLRLSSIVDDVNVTKQWQLPDVFISRDENGKLSGVDDSVLLNATLATVQEQQKEIDQLNGHNMELEARLNKLEAKLNG